MPAMAEPSTATNGPLSKRAALSSRPARLSGSTKMNIRSPCASNLCLASAATARTGPEIDRSAVAKVSAPESDAVIWIAWWL